MTWTPHVHLLVGVMMKEPVCWREVEPADGHRRRTTLHDDLSINARDRPHADTTPRQRGVTRHAHTAGMGELLLIRHAETDFNRQLRFQGHVDAPLNANGLAQAERLAERLADEPVDLVVTSDLLRARQTAEPWVARRGLRPVVDARWREQAFGVLEGLDAPTIRVRHPDLWAAWVRHEADQAPPGGESPQAFFDRVWQALRELAQAHAGARIAVVTHGGALDMVWRGVHGLPLAGARACAIPNTGLNRLRPHAPGAFAILRWADAEHLDGMPVPPIHYPMATPTEPARADTRDATQP